MRYEPITLDTLVELQDQYSDVYPMSPTGARGWVRARRELPKTDPEIYIEWDRTHWRYLGEGDGWTFEHHFRPVQDGEQAPAVVAGDAPNMLEDPAPCAHCGGAEEHDQDADEFLEVLLDAQEVCAESEAYFVVTVSPREQDGNLIYEPNIFTGALSEIGSQMLETQLMDIAMQVYKRVVRERLEDQ